MPAPSLGSAASSDCVSAARERVACTTTREGSGSASAGPGTFAAASIVEIPVHWGLDDWEQYCYIPGVSGSGLIESPAKAREMWSLEFAAMRQEGGCFVLTSHPFLSGRPSRAAALGEVMAEAANAADVWVAPLAEVAEHVRRQRLRPRKLTPPVVAPDHVSQQPRHPARDGTGGSPAGRPGQD